MEQPTAKHDYLEIGISRMRFSRLGPLAWPGMEARCLGKGDLARMVLSEVDLQWRDVRYPEGGQGNALWDWRDLPVEVARQVVARACEPLLSFEQSEDLTQLARHLRFAADYPNINCASCKQMRDVDELANDCEQCSYEPVPQALSPLKEMFDLMGGEKETKVKRIASLCRRLGHDQPWALALQLSLLTAYSQPYKDS